MATSPATSSSTSSSTSTTAPVSIPPDLAVFKSLVERLQAQGVAVTTLRPMPTEDYGPGVEVVLRSLSPDDRGTPEDAIASHVVYRAAVLEKMAGMAIDSVGVVIVSATGERLGGSWVPLDREIDPVWYEPATMSLEEAVSEKQKEIRASLQEGPFTLKEVRGETDPDGTRVLWVTVSAPALAEANAGIGSLLTVTFPDSGDSQARPTRPRSGLSVHGYIPTTVRSSSTITRISSSSPIPPTSTRHHQLLVPLAGAASGGRRDLGRGSESQLTDSRGRGRRGQNTRIG